MEYPCVFCKGTGKDPFHLLSKLSVCQVCSGRKKIIVGGNTVPCTYCKGTGQSSDDNLTCPACNGKGRATVENPVKCPTCRGTGKAKENHLPCMTCHGCGFVDGKKWR